MTLLGLRRRVLVENHARLVAEVAAADPADPHRRSLVAALDAVARALARLDQEAPTVASEEEIRQWWQARPRRKLRRKGARP